MSTSVANTPAAAPPTPPTPVFRRDATAARGRWTIPWAGPVPALSDVLPHLEALGFSVDSFDVTPEPSGPATAHYDVGWQHPLRASDDVLEEAFTASWDGLAEVDPFSQLIGRVGLPWRYALVARALARFLSLAGLPHSASTVSRTLLEHERFTQALVKWFALRHTPIPSGASPAHTEAVRQAHRDVVILLDGAVTLDADRIMRAMYETAAAVTRTNLAQRVEGRPRPWLSLKLDSRRLGFLPAPRPLTETFVYSTTVEGLHLRADRVARGGLRWSDRPDDFRTEVLALMKAQQVKNALIVPAGAKGAFIVKDRGGEATDRVTAGRAAYRDFVHGLLDITDNVVAGEAIPPPGIATLDGPDPYLVVAADKGTATFSDLANSIAQERSFWLGDAFASGGSRGYDHKAMGITARGAWVSVRDHLRGLDIEPDTEEFTAVGVGDMSGDVFGNGVQLSPGLRLVAAFDHRHVFVDPDPDAPTSHRERARLATLPGSSWADYAPELLSSGGGVWPRSAKRIDLAPAALAALGLPADAGPLTAQEVIRAVLAAPVDLLYNGGIGTYVKASAEKHADVGDPANDAVRIDAAQVRARAVAEGGNLGLTQAARIELSLAGVRVNTDFVDNSAGVDTSDQEVNLKILLDSHVREGRLTGEERDALLRRVEGNVATAVLAHNARAVRAISAAAEDAPLLLDQHAQVMLNLEAAAGLDRGIEQLPDAAELEARRVRGAGLTRPEIAVLLAWSKNLVRDELVAADIPDDPRFAAVLDDYFPEPVRAAVANRVGEHRLAREIISTQLANALIDETGPGFLFRMEQRTGAPTAEAVRAYFTARDLVDVDGLRRLVDDAAVSPRELLPIQRQVRALLEQLSTWMLRHPGAAGDSDQTRRQREAVRQLTERFEDIGTGVWLERHGRVLAQLSANGMPRALATRLAALPFLAAVPDIAAIAQEAAAPLDLAARSLFHLETELSIAQVRDRIADVVGDDHWTLEAKAALRDQVDDHLRRLAVAWVRTARTGTGPDRDDRPAARYRDLIATLPAQGSVQLDHLMVVVHALGRLG